MTTRIASTNIQSNTILTTNLAQSTIDALQGSTVPTITQIQITTSAYVVKDDTAVSTSGGYIKITGTNFTAGSQVVIGSTPATSVGFVNSTTLNVQVPPLAAGTYVVYVTINTGSVAIIVNGLTYSGDPTWVTGSTLSSSQVDAAISIQLSATGDAPVTYALQAGSSLPAGLTLTSGGLLSGTVSGISVETTYNFTIEAIDAQAQESPRTFSITITANDQFFEYVTTLLSANNPASTFVTDASTNNFAVSVFGDTRPNNFGPYTPGYYSNFFDGNGDYLSAPDNAAFDISGSTSWCVECWAYWNSVTGEQNLVEKFTGPTGPGWTLYKFAPSSNAGVIDFYGGSASISSAITPVSGQWYHIVVCRDNASSRTSFFINGARTATTTSFTVTSNASTPLLVGVRNGGTTFMNGNLSNLRIVKGSSVYDPAQTTLSVPTAPLTAIANTSILTCQSNRFIDNSTNAFTITRNGDVTVNGFDPFAPLSAYSSYGSGYFDGTGDYLNLTGTAFGTGDFTLECWVYAVSAPSDKSIFEGRTSGSGSTGFTLTAFTGTSIRIYSGTSALITATSVNYVNLWCHVAVVRASGTTTLYINGVSAGTTTSLGNLTDTSWLIGAGRYATPPSVDAFFPGYISNFRTVNGTAVYTTNFTPPAAPLSAIANTSLLTLQNNQPNNNNMFLDSSASNFLITRNGNTTQGSFSPYGGGWSNFFDGNGDFLSIASNAAFAFGTGDFTVEAWIMRTGGSGTQAICQSDAVGSSTNDKWFFAVSGTGLIFSTHDAGGFSGTTTTTFNIGVWYHVAASRSSGTLRMFVNGVNTAFAATGNPSGYNLGQNGFSIGAVSTPIYWTGYISNLRVTKGTALYTSTFTPSTAPLTPIANTSLLTCADNRFIDDSANNFTITRNGDTSIQRFNPFNPVLTTPTSYSGYFDGTGDYLNFTGYALGSGNFTIEAWVYLTSLPNAANALYSNGTSDSVSAISAAAYVSSGGNLGFYNYPTATTTSSTISLSTWTHVAIVRNSGTITLYINGVSGATVSNSNNISDTAVQIMRGFGGITNSPVGYMSNLRVVVGTAVYTSNFTPSTTPLTAIANTSLLTLQNATFIDNSTNNYTITSNGDSAPRQFNPFGWTSTTGGNATYSATNYGGSMYFDGTDYLTLASNSAFNIFNGNMTVECWFYATSLANSPHIFAFVQDATNRESIYFASSALTFWTSSSAGNGPRIATSALSLNTWYHMALVKSGSTFTLYLNGTSVGTSTTTQYSTSNQTLQIGTYNSGSFAGDNFTGYISNVRILKGQALYTSNFAPPVAPLSFNANAVLQVNGTSAAIYDSSMIATYETVGNSSSTTVIKKYGNSSMYFDGSSSYLRGLDSPIIEPGSANLTWEMWIKTTSSTQYATLYSRTPASFASGMWSLMINYASASAGDVALFVANYSTSTYLLLTTGVNVRDYAWHHIAVVRNGSSWTLYVDGTSRATGTWSGAISDIAGAPLVGYDQFYGRSFGGYIDDLRITNGIARYTSNFTPPTTPFIQF